MSNINLAHETFIREMIAHGNRKEAYQKAYPQSSPEAAYRNACRLLRRPEIKNCITEANLRAHEAALLHMEQQYTERVAGVYDKRLALARIIRGEVRVVKNVSRYNKMYQVTESLPVSQILKAIVLDTKLEQSVLWKF